MELLDLFDGLLPRRPRVSRTTYTFKFKGIQQTLSARDSQREKVYRAEREVFTERPTEFKTRRGLEGRVNRVAQSPTAKKLRTEFGLGPKRHIGVALGRAHSRSTSYGGHIRFSRTSMCEWVMLHELSHELAPYGAQHHWPFAYVYLKLISRFMGRETAAKLKAAFKRNGVRFRPKRTRTLTPEQRQAAAERLRLGRIKRECELAAEGIASGRIVPPKEIHISDTAS
jgi:hypothetical protein